VPFDVTDLEALRAVNARATAEIGAPTILVNNAGNAGPSADANFGNFFWIEDTAEWDKYLQTNLFGVMKCSHTFLPNVVEANRGWLPIRPRKRVPRVSCGRLPRKSGVSE
jgi:3-oxoacyl-[acyl-carrier protein] reductase